jgi:CheY-like chemotaxis protein
MEQYARDELSRLGKDGIVIIASEKNGDCELETDVVRLVQIMKNLVNNAIKFTESGSVEIGCDKSGVNVILFVKDSGIGISADSFDLIFDQFRQIDGSNTRKFGGTGLGLAICKNLVHMMGGRIWVESTEGSGATFYVELPLNATLSLDPKVSQLSDSEVGAGHDKTLQVMVVDDEHDSAELFREILQDLGHSVVTAPSGYEALRLLEKPPLPDVVFMDVRMPVLSGTDTMRIMKQRHASIKVVAQSAHALVGDRDRFLNEGFDSYLAKPFNSEQIAEVLNLLS